MAAVGDKPVRDIRRDHVRVFIEHETARGLKTGTIRRYLNELRAVFSKYVLEKELHLPNPFEKPTIKNEGEDAEDPRAELVRRLIEYEQMKQAAHKLDELPHAERDFDWVEVWVEKSMLQRLPDVSPDDLREAWRAIARQARLHTRHTIQREELSVREHMGMILRSLRDAGGFVNFVDLFDVTQGAQVLVVHFLAMLELAREHLLEMTQSEAFAPIYVRLVDGRSESRSEQHSEPTE